MKKSIILTESELISVVRRIINEENSDKNNLINKIKGEKQRIINYYTNLYKNPNTLRKFKNKSNAQKIISYLSTIKIKLFYNKEQSPNPKSFGWVNREEPGIVKLNTYLLNTSDISYNTILHEIGHLIDFKLQDLREDSITTNTEGFYNSENKQDSYVGSETETIARVQRLREMLNLGPLDSKEIFSKKIIYAIETKKITFGNLHVQKDKNGRYLVLSKRKTDKGILSDLWKLYSENFKINNNPQPDIAALFANNSIIKNGKIYLDLFKIANLNINTKEIPK